MDGIAFGDVVRHTVRLIPRMLGKGEFVVVDGEHLLRLQVQNGLFQTFGCGMNIFPVFVILSVFEDG